MSLLSDLLSKAPEVQRRAEDQQRAIGVKQQASGSRRGQVVEFASARSKGLQISANSSAATATPEWRQSRDGYINHLMACRSCYAPTGHYCQRGAELRATYEATPMETQQ